MFIIPTSGNNKCNMLVDFGLYWKSDLQLKSIWNFIIDIILKLIYQDFLNN
jgi:hypothetical protein